MNKPAKEWTLVDGEWQKMDKMTGTVAKIMRGRSEYHEFAIVIDESVVAESDQINLLKLMVP